MKGIEKKDQDSFAKFLVVSKKVLTLEDIQTCFKVQRAMSDLGMDSSLDKIIVEKGYLDATQINSLIKEFRGGDEGFIPGFRIISKLGEGAMGEVYKAIDIESQKEVAIKVLYPHLGKKKSTTKRFIKEAEICQKLDHPNIVKGYEVGYEADQDLYFYVMEYIEGLTLSKHLKEKGVFSEELGVEVALQIASALDKATRLNLVHRDIKPDNIILTKDNIAKLCDLGLARSWVQDMSLTLTGAVMGTPYYISPEAARGVEELDSRSDIYSFGATLFHIMVGRVPFIAKVSMEVLDLHKSDQEIIPPIELRTDISPGFSAIIQKMMAKSLGDRYQNPSELINDLNMLKAGQEPIALQEVANLKSPSLPKQSTVAVTNENKASIAIDDNFYRQSSVQEHSIHTSRQSLNTKKQTKGPKLFDNFFTSAEQRVLSNAKGKFAVLIGLTVAIAILALLLLIYIIIRIT